LHGGCLAPRVRAEGCAQPRGVAWVHPQGVDGLPPWLVDAWGCVGSPATADLTSMASRCDQHSMANRRRAWPTSMMSMATALASRSAHAHSVDGSTVVWAFPGSSIPMLLPCTRCCAVVCSSGESYSSTAHPPTQSILYLFHALHAAVYSGAPAQSPAVRLARTDHHARKMPCLAPPGSRC